MINKILCLMGPTASGKTNLAVTLATQFACEIIPVDSTTVYRDLTIGSAKPDSNILSTVPHHLIDKCDVNDIYSVADFCRDATQLISDIHQQQKYPLLVGGTMLYFRALLEGLSPLPTTSAEIKQQIAQKAATQGWQSLHEELKSIDPQSAQRIHPNDPQRLQRALAVYYASGQTMSDYYAKGKQGLKNTQALCLALIPSNRQLLHEKIAARFEQMLAQGLVAEVEQLYRRGDLDPSLPALRAVGYRQVWQYLAGELTYEQMRDKAIIATRQLAKRQLTWLRHWPGLIPLDSEDPELTEKALSVARSFLSDAP